MDFEAAGYSSAARCLRDVLMGAGIFTMLVTGLGAGPVDGTFSTAAATGLAQVVALTSPSGGSADAAIVAKLLNQAPPIGATPRGQALLALGVSFSALFALNLAVLRHLRRAYASPRRRGWGRGHAPVS